VLAIAPLTPQAGADRRTLDHAGEVGRGEWRRTRGSGSARIEGHIFMRKLTILGAVTGSILAAGVSLAQIAVQAGAASALSSVRRRRSIAPSFRRFLDRLSFTPA
jgi:hypothetical protein